MNQSLNLKTNVQIVDFGGHWGRIQKLFCFFDKQKMQDHPIRSHYVTT